MKMPHKPDTPKTPDPSGVGFALFVTLWNGTQGLGMPRIHLKMADWLEESWISGRRRLLLMAFRSSGKSTLVGLFAAWLLYRHAGLRILVLAADQALAEKMVGNVRRIIERHPLTRALRPRKAEQWAADRFTVTRACEWRDPSMLARGISANMTGSRADIVICDDVEVPATSESAEKRIALRERLSEIDFVMVPEGTCLFVGTPHCFETIYDTQNYLQGFDSLRLPLLTPAGESTWPERFSAQDITRLRERAGPSRFASQMLLQPVSSVQSRLDPAGLVRYDADLLRHNGTGDLFLDGQRLVSASAWWDPAFGAQGGDSSVLAAVFTDDSGTHRLHRVAYLGRPETGQEPQDEATRQCKAVAEIARALFLPSVAIEINGLGRFLPGILRHVLGESHVPCAVREITSRRPKDIRILEAFDAVLAARKLHMHISIDQTPFISEMRDWRPERSGRGHDDGLDAVAGALSLEPMRLPRSAFAGRQNWARGHSPRRADTHFNPYETE